MIVDELFHLKDYAAIHPAFEAVARFLASHDVVAMADGRYDFGCEGGWVNLQTISPKDGSQAVLETHRRMIDVQVPLTGDERIGYAPGPAADDTDYDAEKDIIFDPGQAFDTILGVRRGMFAIFFPQDAHAPGITPVAMRKVVFKLPMPDIAWTHETVKP